MKTQELFKCLNNIRELKLNYNFTGNKLKDELLIQRINQAELMREMIKTFTPFYISPKFFLHSRNFLSHFPFRSLTGKTKNCKRKKGKWETKSKFALSFIPLEISKTGTPDEFISKVRKGLYGGDLHLNILEAKEESKG